MESDRPHPLQGRLGADECSDDIDIENFAKDFRAGFLGRQIACNARGIDQTADQANAVNGLVESAGYLILVGDIRLQKDRILT